MPANETPHFLKGHPKRLLSLDDLMDIRLENFQSLLEHRYIHRLRSQLNTLPQDDPDKGTWLLRLADILSRRFWQLNQKDDLEEAIWYYEGALSLLPQTHYHFLEAILGFCSCVYQRFQLLGHLDDLKKLLEHLHTEHNLNLESLLTPVKVQLRPQAQQHAHKFSDSKLPNQITLMSLNVPKTSSNIEDDSYREEDESSSLVQSRAGGSVESVIIDPAPNSPVLSDISSVDSGLGLSPALSPVEREVHVLRTGASFADDERRRCEEERKRAVYQGNIGRASQMKSGVKRYTALMQNFNREAELKEMEGRLVHGYTYMSKLADGEDISAYQLSSST